MKALFSTVLSLLFCFTAAQAQNSKETTKRINAYLTELENIGFSGTVLVELDGKKVISKGYGFSDKTKKIKNDPSTLFDIGSLTKQFTAAAILKLEMQGKLATTDRITKYFDNVPTDKSTTTIHDLLRHQSGLQSNVGKDYEKISRQEFLDKVMNSKLRFATGTDFSYSNIGYSLLAMIVEKVSGTTYENYLYENLLKPAGMKMTGYSIPAFDKNKIAVGYYTDGTDWGKPTDKEWDNKAPYWHLTGNGGILSTTEELFKWHKALQGDDILSKAAKEKLYRPQIRAEENYKSLYGYGWDVEQTPRNTRRVWHNGSNNIFYADFMRFIDEGITLIMMTNQAHQTNFNNMNFELSRIIFEENYTPVIPIADNEANQKFSYDIIELAVEKGFDAAKNGYKKRDPKTNIIEHLFNEKGYDLLSVKEYDKAIAVFSMNTFAFPKSSNAYDSLAEAYMNKGDMALAIKNYEISVALNPNNRNGVEMLLKLKK